MARMASIQAITAKRAVTGALPMQARKQTLRRAAEAAEMVATAPPEVLASAAEAASAVTAARPMQAREQTLRRAAEMGEMAEMVAVVEVPPGHSGGVVAEQEKEGWRPLPR
jgi:hypothetical protein